MSNTPSPTLRLWQAAIRLFRSLIGSAWEMVVWGNVRAGSISLAGAPRSFRLLIRLGLWLTLVLCLMLLFSDFWRVLSPLQPLVFYTDALAGLYVPVLFTPFVIGLLTLAWAYLLCGALHAHWTAKLAALALFAIFNFSFVIQLVSNVFAELSSLLGGIGFGLWSIAALLVQIGGWLALLILFLIRWRRPLRLGLEFPLVLAIVAAISFASYFGIQLSGSALQSASASNALLLSQALSAINSFLTPFLVLSGVEVAGLGMSITQAIIGPIKNNPQAGQSSVRRLWIAGLAVVLLGRFVSQWIVPALTGQAVNFSWGAVVIALLLLVIFVRARRDPQPDELPWWIVPGLALLLFAVFFVLQINVIVESLVVVALIAAGSSPDAFHRIFIRLSDFIALWPPEVFGGTLAALVGGGMWLRARLQRRLFPGRALFLLIFSLWALWGAVTRSDRPLGVMTFRYEDASAFMTLVLSGILALAALMRRLTPRVLLYLTAAAVLLWALEFRDLLADPLSPAFGLLGAQAAVVSVGIFLNVMSAGNRFSLNTEARSFPRLARSLMYFGYALLVVVAINWIAATHDANQMAQNDLIANGGFRIIGLPLAFWALMVGSETVMGEGAPPAESQNTD